MDQYYDYDRKYQNLRERSKSGSTVERDRGYRKKISRASYVRRLSLLMATSAIVPLIVVGASKTAIQSLKDSMVIGKLQNDFQLEVIEPNAHRTDDRKNFFYDYTNIAIAMSEMDNFDEAVYFCVSDIGDYQTDQVLRHTPYKSFSNYMEAKGYESTEDFKKELKEILLSEEISSKMQELEEMREEHADSISYSDQGKLGEK